MKKLTALLLVVAMLCVFAVLPAMAAETAQIAVSNAEGKTGETVTLEVSIKNNPGIVSGKVTLEYDAAALELVEMEAVKFALVNPETGMANYFGATAMTGDGVLFTATFKVLADHGEVEVKAVVSGMRDTNDELMTVEAAVGTITVECNHVWGEWTETKPATHTEKGLKTRTCLICGATQEEEIPANADDHTWSDWQVDEDHHWHKCTVCGEIADKAAHEFGDDNTCDVCGYTKTDDPIAPTGDVEQVVLLAVFAIMAMAGTAAIITKRKFF